MAFLYSSCLTYSRLWVPAPAQYKNRKRDGEPRWAFVGRPRESQRQRPLCRSQHREGDMLTPNTFLAPALAANMERIPVPLPTSSTTLSLNTCLLWYMEFRYVSVLTSSFSISCRGRKRKLKSGDSGYLGEHLGHWSTSGPQAAESSQCSTCRSHDPFQTKSALKVSLKDS